MKQVFQADDGTLFDTQAECERHKRDNSLYQFVEQNCPTEFNEDAGFRVIEVNGMVDFIKAHYEKIGELLGKKVDVDNPWIVNTKITAGYPPELHYDEAIEVVYSNGYTECRLAEEWFEYWNTSNLTHITKYRKVKQ
jgi:hypothetical protein